MTFTVIRSFSKFIKSRELNITMKKFIALVLSLSVLSSDVFAAGVIVNGSYLPLRAVADALGLDIQWDAATKTVYINTQNTASASAGSTSDMLSDGELDGVWYARSAEPASYLYSDTAKDTSSSNTSGYYVFGKDGMSGYYRSQETGTDTLFSYKKEGNNLSITFKDGKGTRNATIEKTNNIITSLKWTNGSTDYMYFMYLDGEPEFYTTKQLCELALGYYEQQHKYRPHYAEATVGDDNNINIHLYDIVDDHTTTSDWYAINPITASGVDVTGNPIDISHAPLG